MKFKFFLKSTFVMPCLFFFLSACEDTNKETTKTTTTEESKEVAEESNEAKFKREAEKDAQYVVDAYSAGLLEVKAAAEASKKAVSKDVKNLATMIATAHESMNGKIKALAASKNIALPTGLTDNQNDKLENWRKEERKDYEKDFVDMMVKGHKDAVDLYEKVASNATDPEIKAWASQTLPDLRKHLDMTNATWDKIKDMK